MENTIFVERYGYNLIIAENELALFDVFKSNDVDKWNKQICCEKLSNDENYFESVTGLHNRTPFVFFKNRLFHFDDNLDLNENKITMTFLTLTQLAFYLRPKSDVEQSMSFASLQMDEIHSIYNKIKSKQ